MNKGDIIKPAKAMGKSGPTHNASGNKPPPPKRGHNEVSPNSSVEEISVISHNLEGLSDEVKNLRGDVQKILTKEEMEKFIQQTVTKIIADLNENMEVTIAIKVEEKTKGLLEKMSSVEKENESLKKDIKQLKTQLKSTCEAADTRSKEAMAKANYNEQYSRKNNFKIMNVKENAGETIETLTTQVCDMLHKKGVTLDKTNIVAIHRIPGKKTFERPILVKLTNNHEKSKIMRKRKDFKSDGNRLVDDVTKLNVELIQRLCEHKTIDQAWYFNGAIYAKTTKTDSPRYKFDLFDNIEDVINKS